MALDFVGEIAQEHNSGFTGNFQVTAALFDETEDAAADTRRCLNVARLEEDVAPFRLATGLLEIRGGEAVRAKREGEFASMVEVVLDDVPDDPLA